MNESNEKCSECEKPLGPVTRDNWKFLCPSCAKAEDERIAREESESLRVRRDEYWQSLAPEMFMNTDLAHPAFKRSLYDKVMAWNPTPEKPWIALIGKKGACKSRIAFLRLQAAIMAGEGPNGYKAATYCTAYGFAESVQFKFADGNEGTNAKEALREARTSRFLLFDDVGKARATPAVIDGLFSLFDFRYANCLPTIWTANSTPEEFCEGMPPDIAGPLVRRLKESSTLFAIQ